MILGGIAGLEGKLEGAKLILSADLGILFLDGIKAKIESGEIDPVKGTDLDKEILLKAIAALKALSL